eukprot:2062348-Alexandrium_andersonii.AAC.1
MLAKCTCGLIRNPPRATAKPARQIERIPRTRPRGRPSCPSAAVVATAGDAALCCDVAQNTQLY